MVALHSVAEFGQWVKNSDSKAVLLVAIQGLLITSVAQRAGAAPMNAAGAVWLGAGLLALSVSLACTALALLPRMPVSVASAVNPISFPVAGRLSPVEIERPATAAVRRRQAWEQALTLARIAVLKYRWVRRATVSTFLAVACLLIWLGATAYSSDGGNSSSGATSFAAVGTSSVVLASRAAQASASWRCWIVCCRMGS